MKAILMMVLTITAFTSGAQDVLTPGKKSLENKWIYNTSYEMLWYAIKDTSKFEIGKISTQIVKDKNSVTVITRVNMKNAKAPWIDSTIADISTLQPIYHSSYNKQRDMVLHFGKIVTGFYNDKMKQNYTSINDTTKTAYFDSNLYPTLLSWLPLKDGYKQDLSIYDYNPAGKIGVVKASITEVKSGTYASTAVGNKKVWVVTVSDEIGGDGNVSTYYFDKSDRKLWKQEINSGGRKMILQLVE